MDLNIPEGAPADLFISEALDARAGGAADYRREGRAIQELAFRMADAPEDVLPQFVALAMQITGAASAGLSLLEDGPGEGVFRWRFLRGTLESFEGAVTPRNFSPCGVTLDRNTPVLTAASGAGLHLDRRSRRGGAGGPARAAVDGNRPADRNLVGGC